MKNSLIIAVLVVGSCVSLASAAPNVVYHPATGAIHFYNDHTGPLANISILSTSGNLRDASQLLDIPGAVKDDSELPFAFTYLGLPVGHTFAGYMATPGTYPSDLSFEYRLNSLLEPLISNVELLLPEPSTAALTVVSALAVGATVGRSVRRRKEKRTRWSA
jgi:hypothetical protein